MPYVRAVLMGLVLALGLLPSPLLAQNAADRARLEAHRRQLAEFLSILNTQGPEPALTRARAEAAQSQSFSERDPRRADALEHLALALQATSAWEECLRVGSQVVALRKREIPAEPELVALALGVVAVAQFGVGKTADADRTFAEQMATYRTAFDAQDVRLAQKLELHATNFLAPNGKARAAMAALREALAIRQAQPRKEPSLLAGLHQSIALQAIALLDFATADQENLEAERQMEMAIAAAPANDTLKAGLVQMLVVHAGQEIEKGVDNRSAALLARARALSLADKALEGEGHILAAFVDARGRERRGDFDQARAVLQQALARARGLDRDRPGQDSLTPDLLQALGELALRQGDTTRARAELDEALRLSGGEAEAEAPLLLLLAELARIEEKPAERLRLYQTALSRLKLRKSEVSVLYATNRADTGASGKPKYGTAIGKALAFGEALVDVPGGQFSDEAQLAAHQRLVVPVGLATNAARLSIANVSALDGSAALARAIAARMRQAKLYPDAALVFVHGYNNSFEHAVQRSAQLARDLNFDGPVLAFAWPSQGSFLHYGTDKDAAKASIGALTTLLNEVMRAMGPKGRVHVIAHSMGNRVLLPALTETDATLKAALGEVVLASPAIDIPSFTTALDALTERAQGRYTLYASSHDRALYTGYFREYGTNLAGFVSNGEPVLHRGLDSVDVSEAGNIGDRLDYNHDIFATNPVVTEDMRQLLQTGTRPPDRRLPNLVAKTGASGASFWVYKRPE